MDVNGFTRRPDTARITRFVLMAALCASGISNHPALAAAAKRYTLNPQQARVFYSWTNYLAQGPETWTTTHAPMFTPAIKRTIWDVLRTDTQDQALANPMIDYLLWRQSLNARRFAANHPYLSPQLTQLLNAPSLPAGVPPPSYTPFPQVTTGKSAVSPQTVIPPSASAPAPLHNPLGQNIAPPAVPEPSSILLAIGMTGAGLWWRHRMSKPKA